MKYLNVIKKAIDLQITFNEEGTQRYLYCILSDLLGLSYNECKEILYQAKQLNYITCDNTFRHGEWNNG